MRSNDTTDRAEWALKPGLWFSDRRYCYFPNLQNYYFSPGRKYDMVTTNSDRVVEAVRLYLFGDHPLLASSIVVAVGLGVAISYSAVGLLGLTPTEPPGSWIFIVGLWVVPILAGIVCGWYRLGFLAALGSGLASIAAMYLIQIVSDSGTNGDLPEIVFAVMLGGQSVLFAVGGFLLGAIAALLW